MKPSPDLDFDVLEGVYAPSDDTFLLLDAVEDVSGQRVLEMGTGTGLIAVHCAKAGAMVTAADVSEKAVANVLHNAEKNSVSITVFHSDLFTNIEGVFDLILFNPPYLSGRASEGLDDDDERQLLEHDADQTADEQHRQEDRGRGSGRCGHRVAHLARAD